ncbi:hypothetical protein AOQ84DRAFT_378525 [Glonium stellatum]|uniref:Heterokaryon incompatibility domain-containing protein n=1 Tax=Glonium stellatum TaxID=574774 RepID=A0A8E2JR64_9PEZI|nr:hypothetical protein AOQ84DRAFT_378525 [Glonium stellatum]
MGDADVPKEFEYFSDGAKFCKKGFYGRNHKTVEQRAWAALDKLVRQPWWSRVWVLQEVVVPESDPLLNAIDLRDKVFALVGLAPEEDCLVLAPGYSKSMAQVYMETIKYIITKPGRLDILSFNTNSENEQIPSWVPDWSLGSSQLYPLWSRTTYRASWSTPACVHPSRDGPLSNQNLLVLDGILFDEMRIVSDIITPDPPSVNDPLGFTRCIRTLEGMILMDICLQQS